MKSSPTAKPIKAAKISTDEESLKDIEKASKEEKAKKQAELILSNISSGTVNTLRDQVAWILNHHRECRDSDIALMLKFWRVFEGNIFHGSSLAAEDFYKLTRPTSIVRERQKNQNTYQLFLGSPGVRERRHQLAREEKEKVIVDRPEYLLTTIYMDDSGKNTKNLLVGSIWLLTDPIPIHQAIAKLRKDNDFTGEFHFSEMTKYNTGLFNQAVDILWEHSNFLSFKFILAPSPKVGEIRKVYEDMYYFLIIRGVIHEHDTGRAQLPRAIQVWIDESDNRFDPFMIANLEEHIKHTSKVDFDGRLDLDQVGTQNSTKNTMIQLVDLFTGSLNRVLNQTGSSMNQKEQFAKNFLERVNVDIHETAIETINDMVVQIKV